MHGQKNNNTRFLLQAKSGAQGNGGNMVVLKYKVRHISNIIMDFTQTGHLQGGITGDIHCPLVETAAKWIHFQTSDINKHNYCCFNNQAFALWWNLLFIDVFETSVINHAGEHKLLISFTPTKISPSVYLTGDAGIISGPCWFVQNLNWEIIYQQSIFSVVVIQNFPDRLTFKPCNQAKL